MGNNLLRKINVLAVDDVPANLVALHAVLSEDCNLIEAGSGDEALAILAVNHEIDVILMDLQMPTMDGFEAAARIKEMDSCKDIPIIFITAIYKEDPFIRRGYEVGGVDYFSKPFDPEILKMKIGIYASFRQRADVLKERERQIRETEELLQVGRKLSAVLESLPVGVLIADVEGRIRQTNTQVSKICSSMELTGREAYGESFGWWDEHGKLIPDQDNPLMRSLERREHSHNEITEIRCKDGSHKRILCSASPLLGPGQNLVGAVVVLQDITASKKIEEDLEQRISNFVSLGLELQHSSI